MSNFTFLAQNNDKDSYVKQACLLAMSIRASNKESKICLITNDKVPTNFEHLFDDIVPIPFQDTAKHDKWKVQNRWKIYHATPYEETFVMDTDMLVLQDLSNWWNLMQNYEVFLTTKPKTYRQEKIVDKYYRPSYVANDLPNVYCAIHYFKKSAFAKQFYTWLELVMKNHETFYKLYSPKKQQSFLSVDTSMAIVVKMLGIEEQVTNKNIDFPNFVHMKPYIQNWKQPTEDWMQRVGAYIDENLNLRIGNTIQEGVFHYTKNSFAESHIFDQYKEYHGIV